MGSAADQTCRFTVKRRHYDLSKTMVETRLAGVSPEPIHKGAVKINQTWFPVVQAFERALGVLRSEFITDTARRHLTSLGFELRSNRQPGPAHNVKPTSQPAQPPAHFGVAAEWFSKAGVQADVVTALTGAGWRIVAVTGTAAKRGMVVIAERGVQPAGLAVTGFPGGGTTDPAREVEPRAAAPGTRAGDWYADAVLTAMRLRSRRPDSRSVMVLPDFPRYQNLYADTRRPLTASGSRSGGSSHVSQG